MTMAMRWSREKEAYLGPFTYSWSDYRPWCFMLVSWGGGEDDNNPCHLRISNPWLGTLIVVLPPVLRPHISKVYPEDPAWHAPDGAVYRRLGRDYYENIDERSYGFTADRSGTIGDSTHLSIHYGRAGGSSMDSSIEQRWSCFLPWTCWRHIRVGYYDLDGKFFGEVRDADHPARSMLLGGDKPGRFDVMRDIEERVPKARFIFKDFDGEQLVATTHIEEREWRAGKGWFKWLSWFRKPIIQRSLSIQFSGETGERKGSWKGGTTGHSIAMQRDDTHFQAFLRYCKEHNMEFVTWGESHE